MNQSQSKTQSFNETFRELIFGMEDGMVSTMGAITGIAVGSGNHSVVVLSGFVIIAVESISMGVGSYLSNKSEKAVEKKQLADEEVRIQSASTEIVLQPLFVRDGWSDETATAMATEAKEKPALMLKELAYRDLGLIPHTEDNSIKNGLVMWGSYILGGIIPLAPYLVFDTPEETIPYSVGITLLGLFALGAYTTKFSLRKWWKGGLEMLVLAGFAGAVGYVVGQYFSGVL